MHNYIHGEIDHAEAPLTGARLEAILSRAHAMKARVAATPQGYLLDLLDRVARAWSAPDYPYRVEALRQLPARIGFSPAMIEAGVEVMVDLLRRESLLTRLGCDLGDARMLDDWVFDARFQGLVKAQPLGVLAHVSAGNVFVGGVDSLIQGIVTRNVNLMKMSSVDPIFPVLFASSLRDHDQRGDIARALALLTWKGGDQGVERVLKRDCNAIVVYGGADTIRSYRRDLGLHTRLIEYGPKYSFVMVAADALERRGLSACARLIARDAVMWEQSACSSPHVVYVEGRETAERLMAALGAALTCWAEEIPPGAISGDAAVEIDKVRELAKVERAMGVGDLLHGGGAGWTLALRDDPEFETSCQHRTLIIKPVDRLESVIERVAPMGEYIQTVALLTDEARARRLGRALSALGADRMVEIGRMAVRKHGTPHDGTRGLATLVRWTSLARDRLEQGAESAPWRRLDDSGDSFDFLPDAERDAQTRSRLLQVIEDCRQGSPLLRERYAGIALSGLDDVRRLPLMSGEDYKQHLPPRGDGLLTAGASDGYVFSSGGTTGAPKLVYRTVAEQHANALRLGKGLALSVFGPGDVVANLLFAGSMWASFVSYNQALEVTGCRILPISGNLPMEQIVEQLTGYGATAIITIPSVLLSLAEYVEAHGVALRIDKVATGGEHLFAGSRAYLGRVLGITRFASTGYTTNDTGAIGYQCAHCEGGVHHVHEDLHHVELLHPETLTPVGPGEIGKVVVTNLQRRLMPTIRYDVGDLGRWVEGECPCGRRTRRMELLGRADDVLIIGGGNIQPEVVAAAIAAVPGLGAHFQLRARLDGHRDQLVVRVERAADTASEDAAGLAETLLRRLLHDSKEIRAMTEAGLVAPTRIEVLALDGIERNPKTGKIRLTVDERG
ncbi:acyl-CoA reductase [Marichromatium gracile]|uniref:Phenylacetate-coenzyme A ligase PaaK-like adenylate-forming protein n=1 Tax=Marichromatium gracile TaxID=1048 RepID=A0A4R4AGS7_MARGR|nr:acyl-CoA reductase [Marichromatium gracile]MBK1707950.1 CoF synthetase [Marichromatium gracile]TCW38467.1 phenylacetate-coenzyme A ligase PaaK-like adenylate-forming protein [Marichromatium gracile]